VRDFLAKIKKNKKKVQISKIVRNIVPSNLMIFL